MRICLVSDTHRYRHELHTAVKNVQPLDAIFHAGDETSDVRWLATRVDWPIYGVAGNWDTPSDEYPLERIITNYGPRILLTHGHRLRVKDSMAQIGQRAADYKADIVVFGHTHSALGCMVGGRLLVNPGSLAEPRGRRERTVALLEIDPRPEERVYAVRVSHLTTQGQLLSDLVVKTLLPMASPASP